MILQKAHVWKKSASQMLWANQSAVFFDHQYLWKESSDILEAKAVSKKVVALSDVTMFAFHAVRLHDSLIINILGENQLMS